MCSSAAVSSITALPLALLRLAGNLPGLSYAPAAQVADAAAAPRPLMHVLGALDGQTRLPRAAWTAARLAPLAAQFGAR